MKRLLVCTIAFLVTAINVLAVPSPAEAGTPPNITVGRWNFDYGCADMVYSPVSLEWYTYATVAHEWFDTWPFESLKAGAAIVRTDGYERVINPVDGTKCPGVTQSYMTNTAEQMYVPTSSAQEFPNTYSATNNTFGMGISPQQFLYYSSCTQNNTAELAYWNGWSWQQIITDSQSGAFSPTLVNECIADQGHNWLQSYTGLTIKSFSYRF